MATVGEVLLVVPSEEPACEVLVLLPALTRSQQKRRGGRTLLDFVGDGVPVVGAVTVDGAGQQQLFPCPPLQALLIILLPVGRLHLGGLRFNNAVQSAVGHDSDKRSGGGGVAGWCSGLIFLCDERRAQCF